MKAGRRFVLSCYAIAAVGCASPNVAPIHEQGAAFTPATDEAKLWEEGREIEARIVAADAVHDSAEVQAYLQEILDRLLENYPDLGDADPHVVILRNPGVNAYALPHGGLFITTGMLTRLENEAQVATVLGHEATHFLHRHALEQKRQAAINEVLGTMATLLATTAGAAIGGSSGAEAMHGMSKSTVQTWRISSISGYSQGLEQEADLLGLDLMIEAGYDARQAPTVFEHLLADLEERDIEEPQLYSTHPRLQERIDHYRFILSQRESAPADGYVGAEVYRMRVDPVVLDNVEYDIRTDRHASAARTLDRYLAKNPDSARAHYLRGQAIRHRRSDAASLELALVSYEKAATLEGAPPETWKELGLAYRNRNDLATAARHFETYLTLAPDAIDAPIVRQYIREGRSEDDQG